MYFIGPLFHPASPPFSPPCRTQDSTSPMSQPGPFDQVLQIIATTNHYAIGDFLADLFRVTGRSERHGKMLGFFFRGQSTYGVGEVLKRLDMIAGQFAGDPREHQYTLDTPYESLKSGRAALTSYAAQKVHDRLLAEQDAAVDPNGGLHVFAPHKKTDSEPINLRLSWDTYGATTFNDIQAILMKHQPLTFNLVHRLAIPERHDPSKEYRYRPPKYVREGSLYYAFSLKHMAGHDAGTFPNQLFAQSKHEEATGVQWDSTLGQRGNANRSRLHQPTVPYPELQQYI